MTPERWAIVERLCDAALSRDGDDRSTFIVEACAGDEALRKEVESLLAQESRAAHFLSSPAFELTNDTSDRDGTSWLGRQVGTYVISAPLGAGGMGEVYRAHDTRLGRDVAIKILPHAFADDPDRLERFEREARLLAALNHPNIGAIYGIEHIDGFPALVLELVEGLTLAERLAGGPLPVAEARTIAMQIVGALDAAHGRGIIHRDLKPANIKITPRGVAKVLDFGLAKELGNDGAGEPAAAPLTPTGASGPAKTRHDRLSPSKRGESLTCGDLLWSRSRNGDRTPDQWRCRVTDRRSELPRDGLRPLANPGRLGPGKSSSNCWRGPARQPSGMCFQIG